MAHKMKEKWKNLHFISTYLQHLIHSIYACVYIYENFFFVCLQVLEMVNFIAIHMNRHRRASKKKKKTSKNFCIIISLCLHVSWTQSLCLLYQLHSKRLCDRTYSIVSCTTFFFYFCLFMFVCRSKCYITKHAIKQQQQQRKIHDITTSLSEF